jgi:transposase
MGYTTAFKEQMVRRMMGPPGMSATALSNEVGVSQTQLSRWLKQARQGAAMDKAEERKQGDAGGARKWTAEEKLRLLAAATHGLSGEELGALLRREGLYEAQVVAWREAATVGLSEATGTGGRTAGEKRGAGAAERRPVESRVE